MPGSQRSTGAAALAFKFTVPARRVDAVRADLVAAGILRNAGLVRDGQTVVEVSFDEGVAGCELELELQAGDPRVLCRMAQRWLTRHGLWIRSRGGRPGRVKAQPVELGDPWTPDSMPRAVIANCLQQVLPNASAVADGITEEEHVHQLRVGLRRLRTAIKQLDGIGAGVPSRLEPVLADVFRTLGAHRDAVHVLESIAPELMDAGAPDIEWMRSARPAPIDLAATVRNWRFQNALVEAATFAASRPGASPSPEALRTLRKKLKPRLRRLHECVADGGARFAQLDEEARHRVRKRLKQLRYLSEFTAPLFAPKAVDRYLEQLEPAQDALGRHNDLAVARALADEQGATSAGADFAIRWIAKKQKRTRQRACRKLRTIDKAARFWTKPLAATG